MVVPLIGLGVISSDNNCILSHTVTILYLSRHMYTHVERERATLQHCSEQKVSKICMSKSSLALELLKNTSFWSTQRLHDVLPNDTAEYTSNSQHQ